MKKNWIADKDFVWKNSIEIVNNVKCVTSLPWSSRYCLSSILWFCRFCCYCWEDIFFIFFSLSILHPALVRPSLRPSLSMFRSCVHHFHWLTKTIWRSSSNFVNNDFHIYAAKLIVSRTEDEEFLYSRYFVYVFFKERTILWQGNSLCFKNGNEMIETDWFDILLWFWY